MSSCTKISTTSVWSLPPRALYFCVRLYSANPQGLPTVCWCSPPGALFFCVLQCGASPNGLCAVRAYKGFVLRCTVRAPRALCSASPQRLCASVYCTSFKSFVRCEPTKALYSVRPGLGFCVLNEPQELCAVRAYKGVMLLCTVRASRALRGASLQRLCASVYCTSPTSFVRCEPTKTLCSVRQGLCFCVLYKPHELCVVRAYKDCIQCAGARPPGFAPSAYVLVRSYEQMSSCTKTCTYVLYELMRYFCFCTGTCMVVCRGTKHSRETSTPACVMRTPAVKTYIIGTVVKTCYI